MPLGQVPNDPNQEADIEIASTVAQMLMVATQGDGERSVMICLRTAAALTAMHMPNATPSTTPDMVDACVRGMNTVIEPYQPANTN